MSKRKSFIFVTVITLFSLTVVVTVSELMLRFKLSRINDIDHLDYGMMVYDKDIGWKLEPDCECRHKNYDYDVRYSTNSLGFRCGDSKREKQTGLT